MRTVLRSIARRALSTDMRVGIAERVDRVRLSRVARHALDTASLLRADRVELSAIFHDDAITRAWEQDCRDVIGRWPFATGVGSVNRGVCRAIYYLVAALKPEGVIEIGTRVAGSSVFIAAALRSHCSSSATLATVDIIDTNAPTGPWSHTVELDKPPIRYIADFGLADRVDFVVRPALDYLAAATAADLIFLDGSHAPHDVYRELAGAVKAMRPNGAILLHDYYPAARPLFENSRPLTGPYRAVLRYRREGAAIRVVPFGQLPWPTRPGERRSSLALLLAQ